MLKVRSRPGNIVSLPPAARAFCRNCFEYTFPEAPTRIQSLSKVGRIPSSRCLLAQRTTTVKIVTMALKPKFLLLAVGLAVAVCIQPQPDMVVPEDSLPFQDGSFAYASRDDLAFRHPCTPDAPCEAVEPLKVRRAQNRTFITAPLLRPLSAASSLRLPP